MSREAILRALRQAPRLDVGLPSGGGHWITYPDRVAQFAESLATAGGRTVELGATSVQAAIEEIAASVQARRIVSVIPGAGASTETRPHDYDDVDLAVCSGRFGVAENGAVWIDDSFVPEQSLLVLAQHLVLTLDRGEIVHNMHQAYERLSFGERGYGTFVAGPSKTADIEQSLVIGAHGPRSLTVLLTQPLL